MKNGNYLLIVPPVDYPGKLYRGRYAYEHRVNFWMLHGFLPEVVHHKNENRFDNEPENLEGLARKEHDDLHASEHKEQARIYLKCPKCSRPFSIRGSNYRSKKKIQQRFFCSRSCQVSVQQIERRKNLRSSVAQG